jgi:hypothetical protein
VRDVVLKGSRLGKKSPGTVYQRGKQIGRHLGEWETREFKHF